MQQGLPRLDKRPDGGHGLCLTNDVPALNLLANDRIEPCPTFMNVHDFLTLSHYPEGLEVVFWRPIHETLARHRNPLFDEQIGVTPTRSLTVDLLHALYLGVMNAFMVCLTWFVLENNALR